MNNREIAKILNQVAKVLEIKDSSNRFRIIAYERAAQTIDGLSDEAVNIYNLGGLKALNDIPTIGASIAEFIEELIKTGKSTYLGEILKDLPVSEIEFLKIPGVGPKLAVKLAKDLKAKSIEDLKKKVKNGQADFLFKEKSKAKILRGIEIMSKLTGRMIINEARPIAEELVGNIRKIPGVIKADYVGSLRRLKETVGDIDIVATAKDTKSVIDEYTKYTTVEQVLTKGEFKSTILHKKGMQIDLEMVPQNEYGSLLQHLTGSKDHNVQLRTFAQTKSMSVSEHGIKFKNKQYKFNEEKDVYKFLGMDFIPPELREGAGEIEASLKHILPKLIEQKDLKGDLHVHSNWSDGSLSIEQIAVRAEQLGYEYVAVSDHTVGLGIAHGLDEKRLEERQIEIDEVQKRHQKIKILSAVEVNIKADGTLDIKDSMLHKLDLVVASIHSSFQQDKATITNRLLNAINNPHVDIIGHPTGRKIGEREPYEVDWSQIFKASARTKIIMEISAQPSRLDLKDTLCREAKGYGVKFAISTDTHFIDNFDLMEYGIAVARRGWIEKQDVINTLSLKDLSKWLNR